MDPAELRFLIDRSKEIHVAINNPKERSAAENDVYHFARGSIVADRDLPSGYVIREKDIWARRPGSGEISVEYFDYVVGVRTLSELKRNQQIKWTDLDCVKPSKN